MSRTRSIRGSRGSLSRIERLALTFVFMVSGLGLAMLWLFYFVRATNPPVLPKTPPRPGAAWVASTDIGRAVVCLVVLAIFAAVCLVTLGRFFAVVRDGISTNRLGDRTLIRTTAAALTALAVYVTRNSPAGLSLAVSAVVALVLAWTAVAATRAFSLRQPRVERPIHAFVYLALLGLLVAGVAADRAPAGSAGVTHASAPGHQGGLLGWFYWAPRGFRQTGVTNLGMAAAVTAAYCQDASCLLVGTSGALFGRPAIGHLDAGGLTWSPAGSLAALGSFACPGALGACLVSGDGLWLLNLNGEPSEVALPAGAEPSFSGTAGPGIACESSTCVLAGVVTERPTGSVLKCSSTCSVQAVILVSRDSGAEWTVDDLGSAASVALAAVSCTSSTSCAAVGSLSGRAAAWGTSNAGATWRASVVPSGIAPLGALSCVPNGDCTAVTSAASSVVTSSATGSVGERGYLKSTDSGQRWSLVASLPAGAYVNALDCSSAGDCLAVGGRGVSAGASLPASPAAPAPAWMQASSDSGATWSSVATPTGSFVLFAASCAAASCVAFGADYGTDYASPSSTSSEPGAAGTDGPASTAVELDVAGNGAAVHLLTEPIPAADLPAA